eukprot:5265-Heterococcus_DN1.PRE.28
MNIPEYNVQGLTGTRITCLAMDFTQPSGVPITTDNIRLRMLGYVCPGTIVKSIGHNLAQSEYHRPSDIRVFPRDIEQFISKQQIHRRMTRGNTTDTWFSDAIRSHIVILDYYFLPKSYFEHGSKNINGYGRDWFKKDGQIVNLLHSQSCVRAVLLPNFICLTELYHQDAQTMANCGVKLKLLTEAEARRVHLLVIATIRAESDTNWFTAPVPPGAVKGAYLRADDSSGRKFMSFNQSAAPFMLLYSSAKDTDQSVMEYLKQHVRL